MRKFLFVVCLLALVFWSLLFVALGFGSCAAMMQAVDKTDQYSAAGAGLAMLFSSGILGVIWFLGFIAISIFAFLFRPSKTEELAKELKQLRLQSEIAQKA